MIAVFKNFLVIFIILHLYACGGEPEIENIEPENEPIYTFAVAGHAYGNPDAYTSSIYPPLLKALQNLTEMHNVNQLILTGDVLAVPTEENWLTVKGELDALALDEWHIAPGNHDVYPYVNEQIKLDRYMAFEHANCLFILLNTTNPGWSIDSLQNVFMKNVLMNADSSETVFVFTHQLWWLKDTPTQFELDSVRPNSYALFDGNTSFWKDGFPSFETRESQVYFFAGDMGCHSSLKGYYEGHFEQFHFYGSGMGGGVEDNFLYVQIFQDQTVKIDRIDF